MSVREISEEEFVANKTLRDTVSKLLNNPKSRELVLKAQKEAFPDQHIPELDAQEPIKKEIEGLRKEVSDFVKEQRETKAKEVNDGRLAKLNERFTEGRRKLKEDGFTDEGIAEVEKLMESK